MRDVTHHGAAAVHIALLLLVLTANNKKKIGRRNSRLKDPHRIQNNLITAANSTRIIREEDGG